MGCDKAQAHDLDQLAPERLHAIREIFDLGLAARLVVADDEDTVFRSQCRDLVERDMAVCQSIALYPTLRIKVDEIGVTDRVDEQLRPGRPQGRLPRHPVPDKQSVTQYPARPQGEQRIEAAGAADCELCQLIKQLRGQVTKFIRLAQVIKVSGLVRSFSVGAAEAKAYGEATTLHEMTKQRELPEVANSPDLSTLHKRTTRIIPLAKTNGVGT